MTFNAYLVVLLNTYSVVDLLIHFVGDIGVDVHIKEYPKHIMDKLIMMLAASLVTTVFCVFVKRNSSSLILLIMLLLVSNMPSWSVWSTGWYLLNSWYVLHI